MTIPVLGVIGVSTDWLDPDMAVFVLTAAGTAIGGALTLHGRWKARRPIGA